MGTFRNDIHLGRLVPQMGTDDIADSAVTTDKIADEAVSTDKLDSTLQTAIAQVATNKTNLASEITRATEAEDAIARTLSAETTRATEAETTETARAKAVEEEIESSIMTEAARAKTAEDNNATAIATEIARAKDAEDNIALNVLTGTTSVDRTSTTIDVELNDKNNEGYGTFTLPSANAGQAGLMPATDKAKLDALPTNEELTSDLNDKSNIINLADYSTVGSSTLPTFSAVFVYQQTASSDTYPVNHKRVGWIDDKDYDPEATEGDETECVLFCLKDHDHNYGELYFVYNLKSRILLATYNSGNVPDDILYMFGESNATTTKKGLMSATDKAKLDSMNTMYMVTVDETPALVDTTYADILTAFRAGKTLRVSVPLYNMGTNQLTFETALDTVTINEEGMFVGHTYVPLGSEDYGHIIVTIMSDDTVTIVVNPE